VVANRTTCGELTDLICGRVGACAGRCGTCAAYIEAYEKCTWGSGCFRGCSDSFPAPTLPSGTAGPAPAPTSRPPAANASCGSEIAAWAGCIEDNNLDGAACADCHERYTTFAFVIPPTCGQLTSTICDWIDTCEYACGETCGPFIEAFETCHWGSDCFFGCPYSAVPTAANSTSPAAQPPTIPSAETFPPAVAPALAAASAACGDAASAFATCAGTSGEGEAVCLSCISDYVPALIDSCTESELWTCSAMEGCPVCGNCEAEFLAMTNCGNQGLCATITCSS
jgi:hypothetical protein